MNMIKLSVLKNRLSGILPVGHPSFSVVSGILSVVGIPPIPIPEEIQLLMYVHNQQLKEHHLNITKIANQGQELQYIMR